MKRYILAFYFLINFFSPVPASSQVADIDGNVYKTVEIGKQTWMSENLRTTKLSDGTNVTLVTDNAAWGASATAACCWYSNDEKNKTVYGGLYNGYAVNTGKLCPSGWHVSTDEDWTLMVNYLGGEAIAGGKLKTPGTDHWNPPNTSATNASGFNALPGGSRYTNGLFFTIKDIGYWWSTSENSKLNSWYRSLYFRDGAVKRNYYDLTNGFSVRCVKDYQ